MREERLMAVLADSPPGRPDRRDRRGDANPQLQWYASGTLRPRMPSLNLVTSIPAHAESFPIRVTSVRSSTTLFEAASP